MTDAGSPLPGDRLMPPAVAVLGAVAITWLVEWAVASALLRRCQWHDGVAFLLVNAVTNPLANAAYNLGHAPFALVECAVIAAEVPLLRLLVVRKWGQAATLSLAGNGATALLSALF